jgi:D-aminopeptidase
LKTSGNATGDNAHQLPVKPVQTHSTGNLTLNALRPSPRECGLAFSGTPGVTNSIVDVADVSVGYWDHDGLNAEGRPFRTGVTAILPMGDSPLLMSCPAAIHSQNGNGEMTGSHWIKDSGRLNSPVLITNTHAVGAAHEAAVSWMAERYKDLFENDHFWAMPVVAETYDGFTNDILALLVRPEHARLALEQAWACAQRAHQLGKSPIAQGNCGGGMGMQTFGFKGGSGSSSRTIQLEGLQGTLGVFVQSNFGGRSQFCWRGQPLGRLWPHPSPFSQGMAETGSLITIVATDLPLDAKQLALVAGRVPMGVALLGGSAGNYSGEITLAFSTANAREARGVRRPGPLVHPVQALDESAMDPVYEATIQATEEAIMNALFAAQSMPTHKPHGTLHALDSNLFMAMMREARPS